ncbi:MAG: DUF1003 domain-containing protein [Planctomycetaceae bacterium]
MATGTDHVRQRGVPYGRHDHTHPAIKKMHDDRTTGERVADSIARFGGSWPFIFTFLGVIGVWMLFNTVVLARMIGGQQFDPYPYIALNLTLSAMAGLQAPVIMMSQNRASARDEALAADHYREGKKMERLLEENTKLTEEVRGLTAEIHALMQAQSGS